MALWEWAAAGAIFVAVVVLCVRLMQRGLSTLEDERARCLERIREMEEKIKEDQKNMASSEHLRIARAGLEDLLRLAGNPQGMWLESVARGLGEAKGEALVLHLPQEDLRVSLSMRERELKGVRKVAHGRGRWHLSGLNLHEEYTDIVPLMRAISARLAACLGIADSANAPVCILGDPAADVPPELPHLMRRFTSARPARPRRPLCAKANSRARAMCVLPAEHCGPSPRLPGAKTADAQGDKKCRRNGLRRPYCQVASLDHVARLYCQAVSLGCKCEVAKPLWHGDGPSLGVNQRVLGHAGGQKSRLVLVPYLIYKAQGRARPFSYASAHKYKIIITGG